MPKLQNINSMNSIPFIPHYDKLQLLTMAIRRFDEEFLTKFGIEGFFAKEKKGGQKSVHFVHRKGIKQVLKLVDGGRDERFEGEMEIYDKFKHLKGIPKVFEIVEHDDEVVVFEQFVEGDTLSDILTKYQKDNVAIKELMSNLFLILKPIWQYPVAAHQAPDLLTPPTGHHHPGRCPAM